MPLHDTSYPFEVRCLHLDYDEPPLDRDIGAELHRRCTAILPYEPEKLMDGRRYLAAFCYLHRVRYAGNDFPASRAEVAAALTQLDRLSQRMTMPDATPEPEKPIDPTFEDLVAAAERKRRLLADAAQHGLFDPEERHGDA